MSIRNREFGYSQDHLTWDGQKLVSGTREIPMKAGEVDTAPGEVKEVRLLVPQKARDQWLDGALITLTPGTATPVQAFSGTRTYVEQPVSGQGIWVGIMPDGTSYVYNPQTTYSLSDRRVGGSLTYGPGSVQCWINVGGVDLQIAELCLPKFENDNTSRVLEENEPVTAPMFWGLWRMLRQESLRRSASQA